MGGERDAKARLVTKGLQDPGLKNASVGTSGHVSLRSFRFQVLFSGALNRWEICSLDIKDAFLQSDGCQREVILSAFLWVSGRANRFWTLQAPAYGFYNAPAPSHNA